MSTANRALGHVRNLHFVTQTAAEQALASMRLFIKDYGCVSLKDLYDFAGIEYSDFRVDAISSDSIGWIKLDDEEAFVYMEGEEFFIDLPVPHIFGHEHDPKPKAKPEEVDHPNHYQSETGLEAIDVIEAFTFDLKGIEAFCTGNALKYLCRWKGKNGKTDLKKARWYINRLIDHIEKLEKENE
jgi:hypothetical protein